MNSPLHLRKKSFSPKKISYLYFLYPFVCLSARPYYNHYIAVSLPHFYSKIHRRMEGYDGHTENFSISLYYFIEFESDGQTTRYSPGSALRDLSIHSFPTSSSPSSGWDCSAWNRDDKFQLLKLCPRGESQSIMIIAHSKHSQAI